MRIPSSIFGLISQLTGCGGCESCNAKAAPRTAERGDKWWLEKLALKVLPVPNPKISVCTRYQFEETREVCRRMGNTDFVNCVEEVRQKNGEICSEPKNNFEAAEQAMNLKILERGKSLQAFQEEAGARTVKFCADIDWERTGREIAETDKKFSSKTIPLIHRERKEICGEGAALETAQVRWQSEAVEFVQGRPHYRYRNAGFQKVADDVRKRLEVLENIPDPKPGRIF